MGSLSPLLPFSFQHFSSSPYTGLFLGLQSLSWPSSLTPVAGPMDRPARPASSLPAHQGQGHCYPEAPLLPLCPEPHLRVFPLATPSSQAGSSSGDHPLFYLRLLNALLRENLRHTGAEGVIYWPYYSLEAPAGQSPPPSSHPCSCPLLPVEQVPTTCS